MKLVLPYPPSANRYWRNVKGRMVKSKAARDYRDRVRAIAVAAGAIEPTADEVAVTLHLYRPQASGDLDNFQKVCLDALQGHLYRNDSQVVEIHAYRHEGRGAGRVEVLVEPAGDVVQVMMEVRDAAPRS